mgnify:CR=1 FL=1
MPLPEQIFPAITSAITESVLVTDAQLGGGGPHIVYVNPAFERMTGYSAEEANTSGTRDKP